MKVADPLMLNTTAVGQVNRVHQKVAEYGERCNLSLGRNEVAVHLWSESIMKDLEFFHFLFRKAIGHLASSNSINQGPQLLLAAESFPVWLCFFTDSSIACLWSCDKCAMCF